MKNAYQVRRVRQEARNARAGHAARPAGVTAVHALHLINPGPAETPGSNDRRAGAPNHHQRTGSGETTMVGTIHPPAPTADAATVAFLRDRLGGQMYRFVTVRRDGVVAVHVDDLAEVVAEIIADYTDHLVAERDALAEDLAFELNARGGMQSADGGRAA